MKIIKDIFCCDEIFDKSYVAIGKFDGVHLGHREIIKHAVDTAKNHGGHSVVFTFLNHPNKVTSKENIKLISSIEEKLFIFESLGVDFVILQPFTEEFLKLSGEDFVKNVMSNILHTKEIFVGFNFKFGNSRVNDVNDLQKYCDDLHIKLKVVPPVKMDGHIVSSTMIRNFIEHGDISLVNDLLGEPYLIIGEVIHGKKIGRTMGFPTANLEFREKANLPFGVYGGVIRIDGYQMEYDAIINIGRNPTLKPGSKSVEIHILDFDEDIYGKNVYLQIIKHLRSEVKFENIIALKEQIKKDVFTWRHYLKNIESGVDYGDNS
ncbi:MAG: bifunctional riboflavin kinase/FAD synthetase [Fusobacteriaceae bacterium]